MRLHARLKKNLVRESTGEQFRRCSSFLRRFPRFPHNSAPPPTSFHSSRVPHRRDPHHSVIRFFFIRVLLRFAAANFDFRRRFFRFFRPNVFLEAQCRGKEQRKDGEGEKKSDRHWKILVADLFSRILPCYPSRILPVIPCKFVEWTLGTGSSTRNNESRRFFAFFQRRTFQCDLNRSERRL